MDCHQPFLGWKAGPQVLPPVLHPVGGHLQIGGLHLHRFRPHPQQSGRRQQRQPHAMALGARFSRVEQGHRQARAAHHTVQFLRQAERHLGSVGPHGGGVAQELEHVAQALFAHQHQLIGDRAAAIPGGHAGRADRRQRPGLVAPPLVMLPALGVITLAQQQLGEVPVDAALQLAGGQRQRLAVVIDRFSAGAALGQHQGQVVVGAGVAGLQPQGAAQQLLHLPVAIALPADHRQVAEQAGVLHAGVQQLAVEVFSSLEVALHHQRLGLLQLRVPILTTLGGWHGAGGHAEAPHLALIPNGDRGSRPRQLAAGCAGPLGPGAPPGCPWICCCNWCI